MGKWGWAITTRFFGLQSSVSRLRSSVFRLQTSVFGLPTSVFLLLTLNQLVGIQSLSLLKYHQVRNLQHNIITRVYFAHIVEVPAE